MGLAFSNCEARWSYSGFNSFRERLAKQLGMDLNRMEGFGEINPALPFPNAYNPDPIKWESLTFDPIHILLKHSDCDGHLTPEECKQIVPRLLELIKDWPDDDYDKFQAELLVEGMTDSVQSGENLEFC